MFRVGIVLAACIIACFDLPVKAATENECQNAFSVKNQEWFRSGVKDIQSIRSLGLRFHKVQLFERPETLQTIVVVGENHRKSRADSDTVHQFASHFNDIAVEVVPEELTNVDRRRLANVSSNVLRSVVLESEQCRVHLIDKKLPKVCGLNTMLGVMVSSLFLRVNILCLERCFGEAAIPDAMGYALWVADMAVILFGLDLLLGAIAHHHHWFDLVKWLPVSNQYLNKRNEYMAKKIQDLMDDEETRIKDLLVVVGAGHVDQLAKALNAMGFVHSD